TFEVDRVQPGYSRPAGGEVDAVARARPADADAVTGAHVGDEAVADREVEARGQRSSFTTGGGHDPQPLQPSRVFACQRHIGDEIAARRPGRRGQVVAGQHLVHPTCEVHRVKV